MNRLTKLLKQCYGAINVGTEACYSKTAITDIRCGGMIVGSPFRLLRAATYPFQSASNGLLGDP